MVKNLPIKSERQYRAIALPFEINKKKNRIESDCYVEGYATTWERYLLYEDDDGIVYEQFLPEAFKECDMSDVIFQYNHMGRVFARTSNQTLIVELDNKGLFTAADLSKTQLSRGMYEDIKTKLITKMSWAFLPDYNSLEYDKNTRTIIHHKVLKMFDVSAVSFPANDGTEINARSFCNGVIDKKLEEFQLREKQKLKIKIMTEV